jgi:glutathione S-transferase
MSSDGLAGLYHIALPADWERARESGSYVTSTRGVTLADEGFIHCSRRHQVEATANRFYGDIAEVVLLTIDESQLDAPVVDEDLYETGESFPHVYGPIPVSAVIDARAWTQAPDHIFHSPIS